MLKKLVFLGLCVSFLTMSSLAFAEDVYMTKSGKKHHQKTCGLVKNKELKTLDEAEAMEKGYTPCSKCSKDKLSEDKEVKKNDSKEAKGKSKK